MPAAGFAAPAAVLGGLDARHRRKGLSAPSTADESAVRGPALPPVVHLRKPGATRILDRLPSADARGFPRRSAPHGSTPVRAQTTAPRLIPESTPTWPSSPAPTAPTSTPTTLRTAPTAAAPTGSAGPGPRAPPRSRRSRRLRRGPAPRTRAARAPRPDPARRRARAPRAERTTRPRAAGTPPLRAGRRAPRAARPAAGTPRGRVT